jgi:glycolate oxidase iron-sulfur subunit
MQTHFSEAQLRDPDNAESNRILRKCVHCGFCTSTCPTYALTGDELDSPRGRIYLAKDMLEKGRPADARTVRHLDRCLTCLGCMTTCPSGVNYMHLVDHARRHIERTYRRPLGERLLRTLLVRVLSGPGRFRLAQAGARLARPVRALLPAGLRRMVELAPARLPPASEKERAGARHAPAVPAAGPLRRVALLAGCVQPALRPSINEAAIRLLNRCGVEVVMAPGAGCCGALAHHLGREHDSLAQARADIDAWLAEHARGALDAIVVTASGCGTMLKDYGHLFRDDPVYAERARRVAALARDISEVLAELPLPPAVAGRGLRVAYHSACSLTHGQRVLEPPRQLLRAVGFELLEVPEGHLCCGSAGTYNLLQPELSDALLARKLANIDTTRAEVIALGNIGCLTQLARGARAPVLHTVELLDWATGGPRPAELGVGAAERVA